MTNRASSSTSCPKVHWHRLAYFHDVPWRSAGRIRRGLISGLVLLGAAHVACAQRVIELPKFTLASLHAAPEEGGDPSTIGARVIALSEQAATTDDPSVKAAYFLAGANLVLAYEIEPHCSQVFFGFPVAEPPSTSSEGFTAAMDTADELLRRASEVIRNEGLDGRGDPKPLHRLTTLEQFSRALRVACSDVADADAVARARQAAAELSTLLEDPDRAVVSAATFWQAVLRQREDDGARSLAALDLALADPARTGWPFDFFSRLLRCRLLAQRGSHATAIALLLQMEEHASDWAGNERDGAAAVRAVVHEQVRALDDWMGRLPEQTQSAQRAWCVSRIESLSRGLDSGERTVTRLRPAVPVIAPPPESAPVGPG